MTPAQTEKHFRELEVYADYIQSFGLNWEARDFRIMVTDKKLKEARMRLN